MDDIRTFPLSPGAQAQSLQDLRFRVMRLMLLAVVGGLIAFWPFMARAADDPAPVIDSVTAPVETQNSSAAQEVIRQQLAAIRARDAEAAYAFMTHDFHEVNNDPRQFLAAMRFENRAIYNHDDFTFLNKQGSGPVAIQKVRIHDHYGVPVTVIYRLEQQEDGSWLIDSFMTLDAEAQPI